MTDRIKLAVIESQPVFRSALCLLFSSDEGFEVVGVGSNAQDVVEIADQLKPDVIVVDIELPGSILKAIATVSSNQPGTRIVVFTALTVIDHAIAALEAGASGYVLKISPFEELAKAVRTVKAGDIFVTESFAKTIAGGLRATSQKRPRPVVRFSKREGQVLHYLLVGSTNKEIGIAMSINEKTVKHYMSILMQKLNVRNRIEVILAAQELKKSQSHSSTDLLN